ncbi:hypothetical protein HA052_11005 [Chromobacterium haemolyticum]|uniref:Uncharacterized protein n=1 Tax=Chromobacterium fluminis TaxID=3044269 RepID=A0ABX0L9E2_9NEIS|nr:hypothetical protein [Chromobacterium haemolyticum]NHR05728.1 hypothetical protein [Chromobacterium haemolyticum]
MSQFGFGSGILWATPQKDALGNVIANPTPIMVGVMQEGSVDINFENKTLHGQNQFPVAVGRGKGKITGKAKFAQLFGSMFNSIIFGQTLTGGLVTANYDTAGQAIPASPSQVTVSPPNGGTFTRDFGVIGSKGLPLKRVASAPTAGQYMVAAGGQYTFATADAGKTVFINYEYTVDTASAPDATKSTVMNLPMGSAPAFTADLFMPYQGNSMKITLFSAIAGKLSLSTKQDDFLVPEFDFEAFADPMGRVVAYSLSE